MGWGATSAEIQRAMPGDQLISDAVVSTRAITIDAPPSEVWPWLVQMGQDKAGFYTYAWLERLAGAGIRNANRIVPEWQDLQPGDLMRTYRYIERFEPLGWIVEQVEAERFVVVRNKKRTWSWALMLDSAGDRHARLVARTRADRKGMLGTAVEALLGEPAHFVMEVGVLRGIKSRAERHDGARREP
jgi:hypothetical protein